MGFWSRVFGSEPCKVCDVLERQLDIERERSSYLMSEMVRKSSLVPAANPAKQQDSVPRRPMPLPAERKDPWRVTAKKLRDREKEQRKVVTLAEMEKAREEISTKTDKVEARNGSANA
jgi:hypothetical protein|tara:strand:- start:1601 stop:1954 length:354 start_codon:yes stop_codon:yes gene_type:complete